jgi:hypothetical protein
MIASALLTAAFQVAAQAPVSELQYAVKESQPKTGSLIRKTLAMSRLGPAQIAINLPYGQLPEADRQRFNAYYEEVAVGDEPPFPLQGLKQLFEPLLKAQAKLLVEGTLLLVATVDETGVVKQVQAEGSPSPAMTKFGASLLMPTRFKPAVCSGSPCAMEFPLYLNFRVE